MTLQPVPNDRQKILRGDVLFACSMFFACCLFATGLFALPLWEYQERQGIVSANSTSTAFAVGTQQANSTATVIVHATEQAQYKYVDPFNDNSENWLTERSDDEYMKGSLAINGGIYAWSVDEVKQPFVYWANFHEGSKYENFDVYVDSKWVAGEEGEICSGFVFRTASIDWENGAYTFSVCNDSYFDINYYKDGDWETISDYLYSDAIRTNEWNRLEISARGDHFTFFINHEPVYEMTDDRLAKGGLGLYVDVGGAIPVSIWFDNFGLQGR